MDPRRIKQVKTKANLIAICCALMLAACGKSHGSATPSEAAVSAAFKVPQNDNVSLFGKIIDEDWYMAITGDRKTKPVVIWTHSKNECENSVNEFNIKSVSSSAPNGVAKAWCFQGKELRARFHLS